MPKIVDVWNSLEILDNIHIPYINKTYPILDKTEEYLKLGDPSMSLNPFWLMTKRFSYDIEVIK